LQPSYAALDEALDGLAPYGPDLRNGLTSHAPMAVEALCALGRPDAIGPWLARYRAGLLPRPAPVSPIPRGGWRAALARPERYADWSALFAAELAEAPWREVLERWVARLAPGFCASACHGAIRTGHAVRALAQAETPPRRRELADALASWAYAYQELPVAPRAAGRGLGAREAIRAVAVVPPAERRYAGTIVSSLEALGAFPAFAPAIDLLAVEGDLDAQALELVDVFARVYLGSARDVLGSIVFVHGVTSMAALGNLAPHLRAETARAALRFAWQAGCGLYAAFGSRPEPEAASEPAAEDPEALVERAIRHGDEHAIKLAEACVARHRRVPSPACLAAARHALDTLPRA
jgi:hypothetical protein